MDFDEILMKFFLEWWGVAYRLHFGGVPTDKFVCRALF